MIMDSKHLIKKIQDIVKQATILKNKHLINDNSKVNYACIFAQTQQEYNRLIEKNFKLIIRENMEMIELVEKQSKVRTYFSNPPLDKQLGIE